jgi:SAM-dependent methyltransferase
MEKEESPINNFTGRVIGKIEELKEYGGFRLFLKGSLRYSLYSFLRLKYHFHKWHLTPIEWRPYALEVVRYVNELSQKEDLNTVVEIGCGTGDILAALKIKNKIGVDFEDVIIRVARLVHPDIVFKTGSFNDVKGENIDVLITVGVTHDIDPKDILAYYNLLLKNNKIKYFCIDSVHYQYNCDFDALFRNLILKTEKVYEKTGFKSGRKILVYKIINES